MMEDMLTLKEVLAMLTRRGKLLICMTLVFAVLLGGVQALRQVSEARKEENSPEKIEERYQEALETYEESKESLEEQLSQAKRKAESQEEYNSSSLKMRIDPYNVAVTTINFAIADVDSAAFQLVYQQQGTPVDYIISQIQNRYLLYWNSLDLGQDLRISEESADKYLRELVSLSSASGGGLTISVQGESQQASKELADAAYQSLLAIQPTIAESSFAHQFVIINEVTKERVDEDLANFQRSNQEQLEANQDSVEALEKQLEDLTEPERGTGYSIAEMARATAKWMALGAFAGLFLGCVWVALAYIFRGYTESVRRVEAVSTLAFLGASQPARGYLERLSRWILGEQDWRDQPAALSYLTESLRASLPKGTHAAVLSTLPVDPQQPGVRALSETLSSLGYSVRLVPNAVNAPEAISALQSCQCVVVLEEIGRTCWPAVAKLQTMAQRMGKTISGFVTL